MPIEIIADITSRKTVICISSIGFVKNILFFPTISMEISQKLFFC